MDYQVKLNDGQIITLNNAEFDVQGFTNALNDNNFTFVNISGAVVNKHIILCILPIETIQKTDNE